MPKSNETIPHGKVDEMEDLCRRAQDALEAAARIVCSVPGEVGPAVWRNLDRLAREAGEAIHPMYKLRDYGNED